MSLRTVSFRVTGKPEPKGSTRIVPVRLRDGSSSNRTTSDNPKLKDWQSAIAWTARTIGAPPFPGAVAVALVFRLARPRTLLRRCTQPVHRPDVDKLARAVLDALTGVLLRDDAQVVELHARKVFAHETPGVEITVGEIAP